MVALMVVSGGCHKEPPPQMPHDDAWIEIADAGFAKTHSNVTKRTALPFDFLREGVSGTQLVVQFLDEAEARGAKYASNIAVVLQMEHDGTAVECVTKVVPEGTPPPPSLDLASDPDGETAGTTTLRAWTPNLVTAKVDDHKFVCEHVGERVQTTGWEAESTYNAEQKHPYRWDVIAHRPVPVTADWHDECHLAPDSHEATRYEHYVAAHFEPPNWDKLGRVFGHLKLVELPPECHAIAKPQRLFQRVEADLGYSGQRPLITQKPMEQHLKTVFSMNVGQAMRRYLDE